MKEKGELTTYRRKRNFRRTPEPAGQKKKRSVVRQLSFVVQRHHASHRHYDFRLEWDGVLLSWAVPKGPVPDPDVKRLAMKVEDHPLEYADFEGVIPAGEYGGGTVMVWDRGQWIPEGDPRVGLRKGRLDFELRGEKLHGRWTLVRGGKGAAGGRGRGAADGGSPKESWLLFKRSDEHARPGEGDALLEERPLSVVTGRSMEEIAKDRQRVWSSRKKGGGAKARPAQPSLDPSQLQNAKKVKIPARPEAQLATLVKGAPAGDDWLHEIKWDGYRLLSRIESDGSDTPSVQLITRNGNDWTLRFPRIARALSSLPVSSALLDGEAVAVDASGRSNFQALQNALSGPDRSDLFFYVFDLLYLNGWDLRRSPLLERKALLAELLAEAPSVLRYSDHVVGNGEAFHDQACRLGLEGIVSKRAAGPYHEGRGRDWVKTKCLRRQEFVVVGWTDPEGSRTGLGSLVLGVHDPEGELVYAGRVGTGFSADVLADIHARVAPIERETPAVSGAPRSARGRRIHWVEPRLVAEVAFTEWTTDGAIRHPSFQGLREDKAPADVVREREAPVPEQGGSARAKRTRKASAKRTGGTREHADFPRRPRSRRTRTLEVAGVEITNPERVVYADSAITKADLVGYWEAVSMAALPHLVDRPLTLVRCPKGLGGDCFFQKHAGEGMPDALPKIELPEKAGKAVDPYMYVDGLSSLISLVQLGALEFHVWNARVDQPERPDMIVMDVDPGPDVPWTDVVRSAVALRELLHELGLESWPRATGGKGAHVVAPLVRRSSWEEVGAFARALAELMAAGAPDRFVAKAASHLRKGRIYVDHLRNVRNATAIATFSTRARPGAPIAFPLSWKELEGSREPPILSIRDAARIDWVRRNPWKGMDEARQSITAKARKALGIA